MLTTKDEMSICIQLLVWTVQWRKYSRLETFSDGI